MAFDSFRDFVNALDKALRLGLEKTFPQLRDMTLRDYKVRIVEGNEGTGSKTRVLVESGDANSIWGTVGVIRLMEARAARARRRGVSADGGAGSVRLPRGAPGGDAEAVSRTPLTVADVAVLIPAHNEAAVLGASLDSITKLAPLENIHVVSDGSTDDTIAPAPNDSSITISPGWLAVSITSKLHSKLPFLSARTPHVGRPSRKTVLVISG